MSGGFVHDWMLERWWDEEETQFTPNGEHTASGIPIGEIKSIYRRIVIAKKVGPPGGPFVGGGGYTKNESGGLVIACGAGRTVTIAKIAGGGAFILEEKIDGLADLITGDYNFTGTFTSERTETVIGGWAGGGA